MKIYLASGNLNKKREMSEIFSEHTIVIPKEEGIDFNPEETGTDFYQNSMIKARALWDIVHCPVIADDSGICVDALKGVPGVWSARYAGPDFHQGKPDGSKISQDELMINPSRFYIAQETMEGTLIDDIKDSRGQNGFGYDPIFFLPQFSKTVAEISPEQKNEISHRGKACKIIKEILKNF